MAPKVFISHASEDKERFVFQFAEALRGAGIEAWLDQWELRPGDSLIQRIFDEGIAEAEVFIVVLSRPSVNKRWVREELDAGIIRRINHKSRLIPIILDGLDDAEVPEALKATVWVRVAGPNDYQAAPDKIVRTIYGHTDKPPLGTPPSHVTSSAPIPGLNRADATVFSLEVSLHPQGRPCGRPAAPSGPATTRRSPGAGLTLHPGGTTRGRPRRDRASGVWTSSCPSG